MESLDKTYFEYLPYDDPRMVRLRELNAKGSIQPFIPAFDPEYMRREALGFYSDFNDVDHTKSSEGWPARKRACEVSPFIVGLSCNSPNEGEFPLCSSGIVVESRDTKTKKIITSMYIVGSEGGGGSEVCVLLPNGQEVSGCVLYANRHHNIMLISMQLDSMQLDEIASAKLSTSFVDLGDKTMSLGRHSTFGLMASRGKIIERTDDLEADDLMSSTCIISESGIGGPVVDETSGVVIGMNIHINKRSTSFIPSVLLDHYLETIETHGRILCPWLGFKSRNLNEKKLSDLDSLYQKFRTFKGIFVTQVIEGSPAHCAGIRINDIIVSCNGIYISSPAELSHVLLELGKSRFIHMAKRRSKVVEVVVLRLEPVERLSLTVKCQDVTAVVVNKWPAVPLELSFDEFVPFSSRVEYCDVKQSHQNMKNRTQGLKMLGKPVRSTSILDTLFGNGLTTSSESTSDILQGDDPKASEIWNPEKLQFQEEKSSVEKPGSLLSLVIGGESAKNDGLDGVLAAPVSPARIQVSLKTSNAGSSTGSISGPVQKASVLTCESLKQSMLLEVAGDNSKTHFFEKEEVFKEE